MSHQLLICSVRQDLFRVEPLIQIWVYWQGPAEAGRAISPAWKLWQKLRVEPLWGPNPMARIQGGAFLGAQSDVKNRLWGLSGGRTRLKNSV